MIASRTQRGLLWSHNDHGDVARIFAFSEEGVDLGIFIILASVTFSLILHLVKYNRNALYFCQGHLILKGFTMRISKTLPKAVDQILKLTIYIWVILVTTITTGKKYTCIDFRSRKYLRGKHRINQTIRQYFPF